MISFLLIVSSSNLVLIFLSSSFFSAASSCEISFCSSRFLISLEIPANFFSSPCSFSSFSRSSFFSILSLSRLSSSLPFSCLSLSSFLTKSCINSSELIFSSIIDISSAFESLSISDFFTAAVSSSISFSIFSIFIMSSEEAPIKIFSSLCFCSFSSISSMSFLNSLSLKRISLSIKSILPISISFPILVMYFLIESICSSPSSIDFLKNKAKFVFSPILIINTSISSVSKRS